MLNERVYVGRVRVVQAVMALNLSPGLRIFWKSAGMRAYVTGVLASLASRKLVFRARLAPVHPIIITAPTYVVLSIALIKGSLFALAMFRATSRLLDCRITFFTRSPCGLCDAAKAVVQNVKAKRPFAYREINVMESGQEKWKGLYEFDTPVVSR